ncbi:ATP/GTP-binding protein [Micromonospora sp. CP22]|uniref:AAA family ATPase n=1 Tax=Micromonospora sp. CP22 TaxID=2580517 RepID=UPI0012BC1EF9|nr:ATP-binding protein [Micromonospora sp. CP22]MTK03595.1 ATP-binding protein [Micromonospora sp. CP22]
MLLSFRFANHRSFRDEHQLNLTPVYGDGTEAGEPAPQAVQVVGIFGANASGKSNCLGALGFMRQMVVESDRAVEPGVGLSREPFRLDPDIARQPSRYVVDLMLGGVRHTYGFTIDDDRVLDEWLYHYPLGRRRRIFEREGDEFAWGEESGRRPLEQIAEITAPTALFLSTVARFGHSRPELDPADPQPLHDTYRWFYLMSQRTDPVSGLAALTRAGGSDAEQVRRLVVDLLQAADVGIVDIVVHADPHPEEQSAPGTLRQRLKAAVASMRPPRIHFAHRGHTGTALLDLQDQSSGTRQVLTLGLHTAAMLRSGATMLIDEIDASLHPILTAKLISLFRNPRVNPLGSQLIFTSHDAALLGTIDAEEILRRDEIWFVEKDDQGASSLYPLTDFKPRKEGENRQRRYLNGNYGAVPDLSNHLFEQALATRGDMDDAPTS